MGMKRRLAVLMLLAVLFSAALGEAVPEGEKEGAVPAAYAGSLLERMGYAYAECYLLVTVGDAMYIVPLTQEGDLTVNQGSGVSNTFHVTAHSVCMVSSTCENQDCVQEGTVTDENKETRILGNMILCLPNRVVLELYTFEEMETLLAVSLNDTVR